jgi:integrase/recombinase XerD
VLLPIAIYESMQQLKGQAKHSDRVFSIAERQGHNIVKAAAAAAGLSEDVSAHWLRHSNATHAADAGCPIHVIRDNHGHSSLAVTSGYIQANPDNGTSKYLEL